jgi:putative NIF3 family GTP cyclohydrolase 1 type 2
MNLVVAGHYRTETVGVKALMPLVREAFGVRTVFIEDAKDF